MKSLCYIEEFIFNRQNGMNSVMSCEKTQTVARRAVVLEYFDKEIAQYKRMLALHKDLWGM